MDQSTVVQVPSTEDRGSARIIAELRQRHIFKVAAGYGVVAWLLVQVVATVAPAFDLPTWLLRVVVLGAIVGFLAVMGFLVFRGASAKAGETPRYLSRRARLAAGTTVLAIAVGAAALSIRSLSAPEQISLAVLPFSDLSPAGDKAYFAEGVAEEILSTLAAEGELKVLGRSSAREIDQGADPRKVREALGVTHLLEGSTRTDGEQLRVNVRLVDTKDGAQIWEEEYQGRLAEIFNVQDQIAGTVVRRLRGTFLDQARRTEAPTEVGVYEMYLAARALMRIRSTESLSKALEIAKKVIAADPSYAPGHAIVAELVFLLSDEASSYGTIPLDRARSVALAHAREAIRLAPQAPEGYGALGLAAPRAEAIEPLRKAIALDPGRAELRIWLGVALSELGRHDEAFEQFTEALELEPLWAVPLNRVVQVLSADGRFEEAREAVAKFRSRGGAEAQVLRFLMNIARAEGDYSRSIAYGHGAIAKDRTVPYVARNMAITYAFLGLHDRARQLLPQSTESVRAHLANDRSLFRKRSLVNDPRTWSGGDWDYVVFALGAERDWATLAKFYDLRPPRLRRFCDPEPYSAPFITVVIALRAVGNHGEAKDVFDCSTARLKRELTMKHRAASSDPGQLEFRMASAVALQGKPEAMAWLQQAVERGWVGNFYSAQLKDWPQFDAFRSDPRYAAIQKRINAKVARERAEVLGGS